MPLLFYSRDPFTGKIEGAAGTKAIYLSDEKYLRDFTAVLDLGEVDVRNELAKDVGKAFDAASRLGAIAEELHHFRIVRKSKTGRLLYLWNPMLRMAYAACHRTADWRTLRPALIHREAVRYFRAELEFYNVAAPILEAAYQLESDAEQKRSDRYLTDLDKGRNFLNHCSEQGIGFRNGRFSSNFLANVIDDAFFARAFGVAKRRPYQATTATPAFAIFVSRYRPYRPALATPASWPAFLKTGLHFLRPVAAHFGRVIWPKPTSERSGDTATLPGLWCPRGVIDPTGFSIGRRSLGSQEPSYNSVNQKAAADLLWYVMAQTVMIPFCRENGWPGPTIAEYLEQRWIFLLRGSESYAENTRILQLIDEMLMERIFEKRLPYDIDLQAATTAALDAFAETHDAVHRQLDGDLTALAPAISRQYLQV